MALRGCALLLLARNAGGLSRQPGLDGIYLGQEDACTCMKWTQAYQESGVPCGKAMEYFHFTKTGLTGVEANKRFGSEFCGKFFSRLNDNFCMNIDMTYEPTSWHGQQWCYVSSDCETLRGGSRVAGTAASWKLCNGSDPMLRKRSLEDLDFIRGSQDAALGLLAKYAYPVWQAARWPEVEKYFMGEGAAAARARDGKADLEKIVAAGRPVLFDSSDGHPPLHVVAGPKVYKIDFTPNGKANFVRGRMGDVSYLACLQGCQ